MHHVDVMQRHLPRPQHQVDGVTGVDIAHHPLPMTEEILAIGDIDVRQAKPM